MSDAKAAAFIQSARRRVVLAAPAMRSDSAKAIIEAMQRLGQESVRIIMDCDEEVFRLGFGAIDAVELLGEAECVVQQCSGLRIGVLICDDRAWVFAPTALYVQAEVHSDETPNAVELRADDVERIVWRLSPQEREAATREELPPNLRAELEGADTEIGVDRVSGADFAKAKEALDIAPPIPFDVARQVRVFTPYMQYVDIRLLGCNIERRRVVIPKSIQGVGAAAEIEGRIKTTFDLIERGGTVSSQSLQRELNEIRDNFTRSLRKPWGRVILRSKRGEFDDRISELLQKLELYKQEAQANMAEYLDQSRRQVVEYYLRFVMESPPDALRGQIMTRRPSEADCRAWLDAELKRVFPSPAAIIKEMKLEVHYRDVTYETLNEDGFAEEVRKAYPHVPWDKPFEEISAAQEREDADG